jgi:hypothetical protein
MIRLAWNCVLIWPPGRARSRGLSILNYSPIAQVSANLVGRVIAKVGRLRRRAARALRSPRDWGASPPDRPPVRRWPVEGRCEHGYNLLGSARSVVVTPSLVRKLR